MIPLIFACQRRSGGTFLINLARTALFIHPQQFGNHFRCIRPNRKKEDICKGWREKQDPEEQSRWLRGYIQKHKVKYIKIEEPGINSFADHVRETFPEALWLTTVRNISHIVASHYNIKSWGESVDVVVKQWEQNLDFFERLQESQTHTANLLVLNIDDPGLIQVEEFARFLGTSPNPILVEVFQHWSPVNTLAYQQHRKNESVIRRPVPNDVIDFKAHFPQIEGTGVRYHKLMKRSCENLRLNFEP